VEPFFIRYLAAWALACLAAAVIVGLRPAAFSFIGAGYRRFLFVPWKLTTFAIAAIGLILIAPYTGDETWDYVDATFMSVLTFLTAPWVAGTLYQAVRPAESRPTWRQVYVALCLWMFSASWSYDLYLLLRDGKYTDMWLVNIPASSVLYLCAGLMWNADWRLNRGVIFSFMERDWPNVPPTKNFAKVFWVGLPFMIIAAIGVLYFFYPL